MRVCSRLRQNALARLRAAKSMGDAATLLVAGLQLEVAKHVVKARKSCAKGSFSPCATLVLFGIAAGGCKTHCAGCAKRRIGL